MHENGLNLRSWFLSSLLVVTLSTLLSIVAVDDNWDPRGKHDFQELSFNAHAWVVAFE